MSYGIIMWGARLRDLWALKSLIIVIFEIDIIKQQIMNMAEMPVSRNHADLQHQEPHNNQSADQEYDEQFENQDEQINDSGLRTHNNQTKAHKIQSNQTWHQHMAQKSEQNLNIKNKENEKGNSNKFQNSNPVQSASKQKDKSQNHQKTAQRVDLNDQTREKSIKETINKLTQHIMNTKNLIVDQITSINQYHESDGEQSHHRNQSRVHLNTKAPLSNRSHRSYHISQVQSENQIKGKFLSEFDRNFNPEYQPNCNGKQRKKSLEESLPKINKGKTNIDKNIKSFKQIREALYGNLEPQIPNLTKNKSNNTHNRYKSLKNISLANKQRQEKLSKESEEQKEYRKRKHQIYLEQKQTRKQEREAEKARQKKITEERALYEQKYLGKKRQISKEYYEREIKQEEIQAFQNQFIARIKARFSKASDKPSCSKHQTPPIPVGRKDLLKKVSKQNKFKEKIAIKLKMQNQSLSPYKLDPNKKIIQSAESQVLEEPDGTSERVYKSAPPNDSQFSDHESIKKKLTIQNFQKLKKIRKFQNESPFSIY